MLGFESNLEIESTVNTVIRHSPWIIGIAIDIINSKMGYFYK